MLWVADQTATFASGIKLNPELGSNSLHPAKAGRGGRDCCKRGD